MSHRVLVIDDDAAVRRYVTRALRLAGLRVESVGSGQEGIARLARGGIEAVVSDLRMPEVDGLDVLGYVSGLESAPVFILLTAFGSVPTAVEAIQSGASDVIEKPIDDLGLVARRIFELLGPQQSAQRLSVTRLRASERLVGASPAIEGFERRLTQLGLADAPVLIEGESGSGKTKVARELWQRSPRSSGSFQVVNCRAIPKRYLERELFGVVGTDGALRSGRLELAAGGVLVLDEVADLPEAVQLQLLRVLQDRTYRPIGSDVARPADARFLALTSRDLWAEVQTEQFRSDLFFRLTALRLRVSPLRERPEDIPLLASHFARRAAARSGQAPKRFTRDALDWLAGYSWPGNVRQLEHLVDRLCAMKEGPTLDRSDVTRDLEPMQLESSEDSLIFDSGEFEAHGLPDDKSLDQVMRDMEREIIERALQQAEGNQSEAARLLKMRRTTLVSKIKRLGLD